VGEDSSGPDCLSSDLLEVLVVIAFNMLDKDLASLIGSTLMVFLKIGLPYALAALLPAYLLIVLIWVVAT